MNKADKIEQALRQAFAPTQLEVVNESHLHAGHAGDDGTGETHYKVVIRAAELGAMSRINRHRAVHKALGADLVAQIHALALDIAG